MTAYDAVIVWSSYLFIRLGWVQLYCYFSSAYYFTVGVNTDCRLRLC